VRRGLYVGAKPGGGGGIFLFVAKGFALVVMERVVGLSFSAMMQLSKDRW
jgi:hypothetical protein